MPEAQEADLPRLAEGILLDYDPRDRPPEVEIVERDDLILWTRPSPVFWSSTVRFARWQPAEADARIDEVLEFFRSRGRSFVWHVGPSSAPADLAARLERRGLQVESDTRLLVARLPVDGFRCHPDVRVVEARDPASIAAYLRFARREWADDEITSAMVADRQRALDLYGERMGNVLAYVGHDVVANAAWRDSSGGRAVYLTGAGTAPEHRGKGAYQTLVAYRAERALARGCSFAVVQARADTSMPILLRRGFAEVAHVPVLWYDMTADRGTSDTM